MLLVYAFQIFRCKQNWDWWGSALELTRNLHEIFPWFTTRMRFGIQEWKFDLHEFRFTPNLKRLSSQTLARCKETLKNLGKEMKASPQRIWTLLKMNKTENNFSDSTKSVLRTGHHVCGNIRLWQQVPSYGRHGNVQNNCFQKQATIEVGERFEAKCNLAIRMKHHQTSLWAENHIFSVTVSQNCAAFITRKSKKTKAKMGE